MVKGLEDLKASEKETVTLEVELNHANVEGSWTKGGMRVKAGPSCHFTILGKKHTLTLSQLKKEDAGMISFQAEGAHTSCRLTVTGITQNNHMLFTQDCLFIYLHEHHYCYSVKILL